MPKITKYTRENLPTQMASASAFGADQSGAMALGGAVGGVADVLSREVQKQNNRIDVINRTRETTQFEEEMQNEFVRYQQEMDMTDPSVARQYNQMVREKVSEYIGNHQGSADSLAALEVDLYNRQQRFSSQMANTAIQAQKKFINDTVGTHINTLAKKAYDAPSSINDIYSELNSVFDNYAPAMDSVDEIDYISTAQDMIASSVLDSFVDVGDYQKARDFIDENPVFLEKMPAQKQRRYLQQINSGIQEADKSIKDTKKRIDMLKTISDEMGIGLDNQTIFSAATGIKMAETPQQRIDEFKKASKLTDEQMTPSMVAKIGFDVDLPNASEIDWNKERRTDGRGFTPKGIAAKISDPYNVAVSAKIFNEKVKLQAEEFIINNNNQAALASMISFQKLIDDGAAVREGDIKLSAEGLSALDKLQMMKDKIDKGAIATPDQLRQMMASADIFTNSVLKASKTYIDPYLADSREFGYRMLDIGLPRQAYDSVFESLLEEKTVETVAPFESTAKEKGLSANQLIEAIAKEKGMTVEQALSETAKTKGISVEEVKKQTGWID